MHKKYYTTKIHPIGNRSYSEVYKKALLQYKQLKKLTRRKPYIRSKYYNKQKVFLDFFWPHLHQKTRKDRIRRMRYFPCGIDLIKNTTFEPESKEHFSNKDKILHRFYGKTPNQTEFVVQIIEDKRSSNKWLISIFPK